MILRINTGSTVTEVTKILKIKAELDVTVKTTGNAISLSCAQDSFDSWYDKFISKKLVSMCAGGSPSAGITFAAGLSGSVYSTSLRTFCNCRPDKRGNIQLLPGKTLDVYPSDDSKVVTSQISGPSDNNGTVLRDLHRCIWYLYHTYNSFIYRLHRWDINSTCSPMYKDTRLLGTIPSYQAVVAAWNMRVWRKSFLWTMSVVKDSISFSVGYMAVDCKNPSIVCKVKLHVNQAANDSIGYYTLYKQGVATNIEGTPPEATIIKDGSIHVDGMGTDDMAVKGEDGVWSTIDLTINLTNLAQGEYYKGMFSLAVAQNSKTKKKYKGLDVSKPHVISVECSWIVSDNTTETYVINEGGQNIPSMILEESSGEPGVGL